MARDVNIITTFVFPFLLRVFNSFKKKLTGTQNDGNLKTKTE